MNQSVLRRLVCVFRLICPQTVVGRASMNGRTWRNMQQTADRLKMPSEGGASSAGLTGKGPFIHRGAGAAPGWNPWRGMGRSDRPSPSFPCPPCGQVGRAADQGAVSPVVAAGTSPCSPLPSSLSAPHRISCGNVYNGSTPASGGPLVRRCRPVRPGGTGPFALGSTDQFARKPRASPCAPWDRG